MNKDLGITAINNFYQSYNDKTLSPLLALIAPNIAYHINHQTERGKERFEKYMQDSLVYFDEKVSNIILASSDDGKYVFAEFTFSGTYINTDPSLKIEATGQGYAFRAINRFTFNDNDQISDVVCFYNEGEFVGHLSSVTSNEL